ncbi:eukaryotic translation initiation factor subunit eIF2A, putative [Plasmodium relictum]|uniref:Eukaryotic translation initiation factor subunit eIF2A, putative n=1 Tax=Plasmodium relictum TaxID=85471 RepID=A0A1J1H297_PLARL|nr:eukaryotic translation initiation factor subunit eIF2A, putative [Plasmodium relictum]CRG99051.1 eukaryotic translation initiation factor subunit eIF2A, putative [Plasmodium relictum]
MSELLIRSKSGIKLYKFDKNENKYDSKIIFEYDGCIHDAIWSYDGNSFLILHSVEGLLLITNYSEENKKINKITCLNKYKQLFDYDNIKLIKHVQWSPNNKFIVFFFPYEENKHVKLGNLLLWNVKDNNVLCSFKIKKKSCSNWPIINFTDDDGYFFLQKKSEVYVYDTLQLIQNGNIDNLENSDVPINYIYSWNQPNIISIYLSSYIDEKQFRYFVAHTKNNFLGDIYIYKIGGLINKNQKKKKENETSIITNTTNIKIEGINDKNDESNNVNENSVNDDNTINNNNNNGGDIKNNSDEKNSCLNKDIIKMELLIRKSFDNLDNLNCMWSESGKHVILLVHTNDTTNKSYGYLSNCYYCSLISNNFSIKRINENIAQDVKWSKTKDEFLIIEGKSDNTIYLYDHELNIKCKFLSQYKNTIKWCPFGNMIALGGFGNLAGDINFYYKEKDDSVILIKEYREACTVLCDWSNDGLLFMTASTYPRMKVENTFKIYTYEGNLVNSFNFNELYDVKWKNSLPGFFKEPIKPKANLKDNKKSVYKIKNMNVDNNSNNDIYEEKNLKKNRNESEKEKTKIKKIITSSTTTTNTAATNTAATNISTTSGTTATTNNANRKKKIEKNKNAYDWDVDWRNKNNDSKNNNNKNIVEYINEKQNNNDTSNNKNLDYLVDKLCKEDFKIDDNFYTKLYNYEELDNKDNKKQNYYQDNSDNLEEQKKQKKKKKEKDKEYIKQNFQLKQMINNFDEDEINEKFLLNNINLDKDKLIYFNYLKNKDKNRDEEIEKLNSIYIKDINKSNYYKKVEEQEDKKVECRKEEKSQEKKIKMKEKENKSSGNNLTDEQDKEKEKEQEKKKKKENKNKKGKKKKNDDDSNNNNINNNSNNIKNDSNHSHNNNNSNNDNINITNNNNNITNNNNNINNNNNNNDSNTNNSNDSNTNNNNDNNININNNNSINLEETKNREEENINNVNEFSNLFLKIMKYKNELNAKQEIKNNVLYNNNPNENKYFKNHDKDIMNNENCKYISNNNDNVNFKIDMNLNKMDNDNINLSNVDNSILNYNKLHVFSRNSNPDYINHKVIDTQNNNKNNNMNDNAVINNEEFIKHLSIIKNEKINMNDKSIINQLNNNSLLNHLINNKQILNNNYMRDLLDNTQKQSIQNENIEMNNDFNIYNSSKSNICNNLNQQNINEMKNVNNSRSLFYSESNLKNKDLNNEHIKNGVTYEKNIVDNDNKNENLKNIMNYQSNEDLLNLFKKVLPHAKVNIVSKNQNTSMYDHNNLQNVNRNVPRNIDMYNEYVQQMNFKRESIDSNFEKKKDNNNASINEMKTEINGINEYNKEHYIKDLLLKQNRLNQNNAYLNNKEEKVLNKTDIPLNLKIQLDNLDFCELLKCYHSLNIQQIQIKLYWIHHKIQTCEHSNVVANMLDNFNKEKKIISKLKEIRLILNYANDLLREKFSNNKAKYQSLLQQFIVILKHHDNLYQQKKEKIISENYNNQQIIHFIYNIEKLIEKNIMNEECNQSNINDFISSDNKLINNSNGNNNNNNKIGNIPIKNVNNLELQKKLIIQKMNEHFMNINASEEQKIIFLNKLNLSDAQKKYILNKMNLNEQNTNFLNHTDIKNQENINYSNENLRLEKSNYNNNLNSNYFDMNDDDNPSPLLSIINKSYDNKVNREVDEVNNDNQKNLAKKYLLLDMLKNKNKNESENNDHLNEDYIGMKHLSRKIDNSLQTNNYNLQDELAQKLKNIVNLYQKDQPHSNQIDQMNYSYQTNQLEQITYPSHINQQPEQRNHSDQICNQHDPISHSDQLKQEQLSKQYHFSSQQKDFINYSNFNSLNKNVNINANNLNQNSYFSQSRDDSKNINAYLRILNNENMLVNQKNRNDNSNSKILSIRNIIDEQKVIDNSEIHHDYLMNDQNKNSKFYFMNQNGENSINNHHSQPLLNKMPNKYKISTGNKPFNNTPEKKPTSNILEIEETKRPDALRDKCWQYVDPKGVVQGPFFLDEMRVWSEMGYFEPMLPVRCCDSDRFVALNKLFPPPHKPFTIVPKPQPILQWEEEIL